MIMNNYKIILASNSPRRKELLAGLDIDFQVRVIDGIDESYALGPMQYGLAAALVADENPALAAFLESRYEELRDRYAITYCSRMEDIENWYGGLEYGQFGRW